MSVIETGWDVEGYLGYFFRFFFVFFSFYRRYSLSCRQRRRLKIKTKKLGFSTEMWFLLLLFFLIKLLCLAVSLDARSFSGVQQAWFPCRIVAEQLIVRSESGIRKIIIKGWLIETVLWVLSKMENKISQFEREKLLDR